MAMTLEQVRELRFGGRLVLTKQPENPSWGAGWDGTGRIVFVQYLGPLQAVDLRVVIHPRQLGVLVPLEELAEYFSPIADTLLVALGVGDYSAAVEKIQGFLAMKDVVKRALGTVSVVETLTEIGRLRAVERLYQDLMLTPAPCVVARGRLEPYLQRGAFAGMTDENIAVWARGGGA